MTIAGKAKLNQEAKFTTLPFLVKSLKRDVGYCVMLPGNHQAPYHPQ